MEKILVSDRTNFSLSEKPRDRKRSHLLLKNPAVVVRAAEQPFSPPTATEHQSPERFVPMGGSVRCQQDLQILAGRVRISQLKLNSLPFLNDVADRDRPGLFVRTEQVSNEEIAAAEAISMFVDGDAYVQSAMGMSALHVRQTLENRLEPVERWSAAKLIDAIAFRPRDDVAFSNWATALGNHGSNGEGACELDTDYPILDDVTVQEKPVFSLTMAAAGESAHGSTIGIAIGQDRQYVRDRR